MQRQNKFSPVLLMVMLALTLVGPAYSAPDSLVEPATAVQGPALLQFTAGGHALGFTSNSMYAASGSHALRVDFVDANTIQPQADSTARADGKAAPLSHVSYADLWDGISLIYSAGAGGIYTTTYNLAPGADPKKIRLRYNAPLTLNKNGALTIAFETGTLTESEPIAWQEINGERIPVQAVYTLSGDEVGFALGSYDPRHPVTIDPTLAWNTFLGAAAGDEGHSIAVDGSGNVYVTGYSWETWGSPVRAFSSSYDAFAAKLDSSGVLIWNTFLGGIGNDIGNGIAVDGSGKVYVAGRGSATWGSPVRDYTSGDDAFAAKLTSSGALTWNTFLGGSSHDYGYAIAVDGSGNVYVAGQSLVTWGNPVRVFTGSGATDDFAAKLTSAGALTWNTFLGGLGYDQGYGIAVDGSGNVYVAGVSGATWGIPVRVYTSGDDAFAAKLNSSGVLIWNTFLGGSGTDYGYGIAVDGSGNVYVAGQSLATWGSPVRAYTSGYDAFAAKLDSTGALTWNTFLGGSANDSGNGIALDGSGNVYVAGHSEATWGSPVRAYTLSVDAYASQLDPSGNLIWNTFLGGSGIDSGRGIAVHSSGNVYVAGYSSAVWGCSPTACTVGAYTAGSEAFVAKLVFFKFFLPLILR